MEITLDFAVFFFTGIVMGRLIVKVAKQRGPFILLFAMVMLSIPLFTIGPEPTILGIYAAIAVYLLQMAFKLLRNPSKFNEFWLNLDNGN